MSNNEQLFAEIIPSEEASLSGGGGYGHGGRQDYYYRRYNNTADAVATADAIGPNTDTFTRTDAFAVYGERSSSFSESSARAY
ncbi:MAG: hypothetical protein AB4206_01130 [Xenococcaceae cyanobacterium]